MEKEISSNTSITRGGGSSRGPAYVPSVAQDAGSPEVREVRELALTKERRAKPSNQAKNFGGLTGRGWKGERLPGQS